MATTVDDLRLVAEDADSGRWLLCRAGARLCALPIEAVIETARLLPIEPLARSAPFILGLCILRGVSVPVIDAALLLGEQAVQPQRLVAIRVGGRSVALAVDAVIGLRSLRGEALPPLLREAAGDVISAIATLDAELLLVLDGARLVPEAVLEDAYAQGAAQ